MSSLSTPSGQDAHPPGNDAASRAQGTPPGAAAAAVQPLPARSPLRTLIRWLPVIATVILAAFTVMQAFGKMSKAPAAQPGVQCSTANDTAAPEQGNIGQ